MGILNVTPDSFSDGGRHFDLAAAVARAKAMVAEGAAIVDVGGESTRPGHVPVSEDEELRRVVPALEALAELDAPISIDTSKAAVAREAARLGACVINDVWGLQRDPGMADAVAETGSAVVVMHNRDETDPAIDILDDVERFFERSLNLAAGAGVPFGRILLDPGVGFGKSRQQNHACIWNLDRFRRLGRRSWSGSPASRSSAGSLTPRSIGGSPARSPPTRLRSCEGPRFCACMTSSKTARRSPSSWRSRPPPRLRSQRSSEDDGKARIVLALGGNVGDKVKSLRRALRAIAAEPAIELAAVSRLYRTPPWGKTDQDWFVNACALGRTTLKPEALLERVKALEVELGREPTERWGPRVIDIDLIAYDDVTLKTERLTLPHPELFNRAFVLAPLAEIAPDLVIGGVRVGDAAARLGAEAEQVLPLD